MSRGGRGGTDKEFFGGYSIRWQSTGGDSAVRFRSATEALAEWTLVMQKCTFTTFDIFEFLGKMIGRDIAENGGYFDAPWPEDGDSYKHKFGEPQQRRLAKELAAFQKAKIVVRFGDHPLIRELYPESIWKWNVYESRTQANKPKREVLLTKNIAA